MSWTTVRLVLILCQVHGLHSRQVDYVNAYCQATLNEELLMEKTKDKNILRHTHVLKLLMSLYGLRQAGKIGSYISKLVYFFEVSYNLKLILVYFILPQLSSLSMSMTLFYVDLINMISIRSSNRSRVT